MATLIHTINAHFRQGLHSARQPADQPIRPLACIPIPNPSSPTNMFAYQQPQTNLPIQQALLYARWNNQLSAKIALVEKLLREEQLKEEIFQKRVDDNRKLIEATLSTSVHKQHNQLGSTANSLQNSHFLYESDVFAQSLKPAEAGNGFVAQKTKGKAKPSLRAMLSETIDCKMEIVRKMKNSVGMGCIAGNIPIVGSRPHAPEMAVKKEQMRRSMSGVKMRYAASEKEGALRRTLRL